MSEETKEKKPTEKPEVKKEKKAEPSIGSKKPAPAGEKKKYTESEVAVIKAAATASVNKVVALAEKLGNKSLAKAANAMLKEIG